MSWISGSCRDEDDPEIEVLLRMQAELEETTMCTFPSMPADPLPRRDTTIAHWPKFD